jgi:hypothetical protein
VVILIQLTVFLQVFLPACSSKKKDIFLADTKKAEQFLNQLLFEEEGIFTLLGDKPITELLVYLKGALSFEEIPEDLRDQCFTKEDHTRENMEAWKNFSKNLRFPRFRLVEIACPTDEGHTLFLFVNIEQTRKTFQKYQDKFKEITQIDLSFEEAIKELENFNSPFWMKVLSDQYLMGLIFGYGEENIQFFLTKILPEENPDNFTFSEKFKGLITKDHFPIPHFRCADSINDPTCCKYRTQREKIKLTFRDKDMMETSLEELQK